MVFIDTVDFELLLAKLKAYGVDDLVRYWFESYLTDRNQKCFVHGRLSDTCTISREDPQGSIIGLSFIVFALSFINAHISHICTRRVR